jgi:hypothetical protein
MLFTAAILATAAAVAPPRIELDLSAMNNAYKQRNEPRPKIRRPET